MTRRWGKYTYEAVAEILHQDLSTSKLISAFADMFYDDSPEHFDKEKFISMAEVNHICRACGNDTWIMDKTGYGTFYMCDECNDYVRVEEETAPIKLRDVWETI